jgi:phage terminase small subunit
MLLRRKPPATASTSGNSLPDAPSFSDLNAREALFVVEYVARSGVAGSGADAALAAGYSNGNRNAAHSMASRLLRRPAVLRAIKEETGRRLAGVAPLGVATLENLARSARSEQVRLAAANALIDRGYGPVVSRSASANLNVNAGIEELLDRVERQEHRPPPVDVTQKAE